MGGGGEILGGIWSLLALLGSFLGVFFSYLYLEWSSKVVLEASGLDFGSILEGLGRIWGALWEGFGRDFHGFGVVLAYSGLYCVILGYWSFFRQSWEVVLLALACCGLFWLVLACFGCFSCLRFPFHCCSGIKDPLHALRPEASVDL